MNTLLASLRVAAFACSACLAATRAQTPIVADAGPITGSTQAVKFGSAVALWGERAAVGTPIAFIGATSVGAVELLERQPSGAWTKTAALGSPTPSNYDAFGTAIAMHGDWLVVGAPRDEVPGGITDTGRAFVYERQPDASWVLRASLSVANPVQYDWFGQAVALRPGRALVGAPDRDLGASSAGAAYVFEPDATGAWVQVAELAPNQPQALVRFGRSVALSGDRALVGAPSNVSGTNVGRAHVFERGPSGMWTEIAVLTPSDGSVDDHFGFAVALAGTRAMVSSYKHRHAGVKRGAIYVYERTATGQWVELQEFRSHGGTPGEQFGVSLALEGDEAVIGAPGNNDGELLSGRAYSFRLAASGAWEQDAVLAMPQLEAYADFGASAALYAGRALVGAPDAKTGGNFTGRGYVFDLWPLDASDSRLSLSQGGTIAFELDAGFAHAGEFALVLGSASGTLPGQVIAPGLVLPLNADAYFLYTLAQPNHAPLSGSLQLLGPGGAATAAFTLPAAGSAALIGTTVHHAFATISTATASATFASNARVLELVP